MYRLLPVSFQLNLRPDEWLDNDPSQQSLKRCWKLHARNNGTRCNLILQPKQLSAGVDLLKRVHYHLAVTHQQMEAPRKHEQHLIHRKKMRRPRLNPDQRMVNIALTTESTITTEVEAAITKNANQNLSIRPSGFS